MEKKSGKNEIVLDNLPITHYISIFCQMIRVSLLLFAILLTNVDEGGGNEVLNGILKGHPVITCSSEKFSYNCFYALPLE